MFTYLTCNALARFCICLTLDDRALLTGRDGKGNIVGTAVGLSDFLRLKPGMISIADSKQSGVKWSLQTNVFVGFRKFWRRILRSHTSFSSPFGKRW